MSDSSNRQSEDRFRSIFDSAPICIFQSSVEGRILAVNETGVRLFGYDSAQQVIEQVTDAGHMLFEDTARRDEILRQVLATEGFVRSENVYRRKDGSTFIANLYMRAVRDNGQVTLIEGFVEDITDRKRAEEALRESEQRYRSLIERIRTAIVVHGPDTCIVAANPAAQELLGVPQDELLGKTAADPIWSFLRDDGTAMPAEEFPANRAIATRQPLRDIVCGVRRPNTRDVIWVLINADAVLDEQGELSEVIVSFVEITERRQTEQALGESRQKLKMVLDTIPVRVFWKDKNSVFQGCNWAFAADAGLTSPEEIVGRDDHDMPWLDQAELYRADDRAVMETGEPKLNYEEQQTTPDGRTIWLRTSKIPLRDAAGQVVGVMGTYEEITERKNAERAALDRQARLDSIFRAAPIGIGMVVNRVLTEVNERICEMTGYRRDELIGQSARVLYPTQEDYELVGESKYEQIAACGTGAVETEMQRKDGSIFDVLLCSTPIDRADLSQGVTFTMLDITDRKRSEADKRAFYRSTIMSVTNGKLLICDSKDVEPYLCGAQVSIDVQEATDMTEAREAARAVCDNAGIRGGRLDEFLIAAGEAITNAVKHGTAARAYAGASDSTVWIGVTDQGTGIDSIILPRAILKRGFSTKPSLGLGYWIMLEVADQVFLCTGPTGTTVVLVLNIEEQPQPTLSDIVDTWGSADTSL